MYEWALVYMKPMGWFWGQIGWLAAFFYAASTALRLARFNTRIGTQDKRFFQGLPSPAAAALLMGMIWMWHDLGFEGANFQLPALLITVIAGALMVSNISYYSFKDFDLRERVPFVAMLAIVLGLMLLSLDPPKVLFTSFAVYTLSGPVLAVIRWRRKRGATAYLELIAPKNGGNSGQLSQASGTACTVSNRSLDDMERIVSVAPLHAVAIEVASI